MILSRLPIRRGDGPYVHATPFTVMVAGTPVTTTAEWLTGDGAGHSLRMQIRSRAGDAGQVLLEVKDLRVGDIGGQMHLIATLWPEDTAKLPLRGQPVGDLELRRSGDRVDTVVAFEFDVLGDVTR